MLYMGKWASYSVGLLCAHWSGLAYLICEMKSMLVDFYHFLKPADN